MPQPLDSARLLCCTAQWHVRNRTLHRRMQACWCNQAGHRVAPAAGAARTAKVPVPQFLALVRARCRIRSVALGGARGSHARRRCCCTIVRCSAERRHQSSGRPPMSVTLVRVDVRPARGRSSVARCSWPCRAASAGRAPMLPVRHYGACGSIDGQCVLPASARPIADRRRSGRRRIAVVTRAARNDPSTARVAGPHARAPRRPDTMAASRA